MSNSLLTLADDKNLWRSRGTWVLLLVLTVFCFMIVRWERAKPLTVRARSAGEDDAPAYECAAIAGVCCMILIM